MPRPDMIAIDGTVASGKTSVGRMLAGRLGYRFLDTGIMYRAVTWAALERDVPVEDEPGLSRLAGSAAIRVGDADGKGLQVDGEKLDQELREPRIDQVVSLVARVPGVREALVRRQREIAEGGRIVMVGRDIGTVVLPTAPLKLFLLASVAERASRRHLELTGEGQDVEYGKVLKELETRDRIDSTRAAAPLRPAEDAHMVDTDGLDLEQVLERVLRLVGK